MEQDPANIYNLLTGEEKSIKDAILKIGQTALKSLAKTLSQQMTDSIMGLFGKKTEKQKDREFTHDDFETGSGFWKAIYV